MGVLIPQRIKVLEKFINDRCTGAKSSASEPVGDDMTIGGSAVGSPKRHLRSVGNG
ncbi:MAG TPA: hypothetical protein VLT33_24295 [Labilithrix sp.]|nr:hypothetical protein [Labilithrix sp.]